MNGFRRFIHIVFALSGLAALAALISPWLGPFTQQSRDMLYTSWYFIALQVLCVITAVGLIVVLLRAIFMRDPKNIVITRMDGGQVSVSRDAVASQAAHIVEADGSCTADRVRVNPRGGRVDVSMRVHPRSSLDVVEKGSKLHADLVNGLAAVCGDKVGNINLDFVQPESVTDTAPVVASYTPASYDSYTADPAAETATAAEPHASESTGDITVPMGDFSSPALEAAPEE